MTIETFLLYTFVLVKDGSTDDSFLHMGWRRWVVKVVETFLFESLREKEKFFFTWNVL